MGKDSQREIERSSLSAATQQKFDELVALLSTERFGSDGPPKDTTFAEIEQFGHEAGRLLGRAVDAHLTAQHGEHFQGEAPCPTCETMCTFKEHPAVRKYQTTDGTIPLSEPVCHCPACQRDFFPSAYGVEDRWLLLQSQSTGVGDALRST